MAGNFRRRLRKRQDEPQRLGFKMPFFYEATLSIAILLLALLSPARAADSDVLNMVFVPASEKGDESDYESLIKIISDQAQLTLKLSKSLIITAVEASEPVEHISGMVARPTSWQPNQMQKPYRWR